VIEVRKDFGYPIMVTPFSQHVVTQAMINVTVGERYREVTDESIQYALGYWGKEAGSAMAPESRARILDRPRARELAAVEPQEPSIQEIRQKLGGPGISDDELILRYIMGGEEELKAMRPAPPITEYLTARSPIVTLVKKLLKQDRSRYIHLEKGNLKLRLQKF
ncbi:MAG: hypothetical protein Q8P24_06945, partial [Desulfobacterales bacterium]|nr:hypothetical protein [Desulfobacterales bacterium]